MNKMSSMMMGAFLLAASACSNTVSPGSEEEPSPDAGLAGEGSQDGGMEPGGMTDDDPPLTDCTVAASLSIEPLVGGTTLNRPVDPIQPEGLRVLTLLLRVTNAEEPADGPIADYLRLDLHEGHGGERFRTGTFDLAGVDTEITDCKQCVFFLGDTDVETGQPAQVLMAESGMMTITSLDPTPDTGTFDGSLSNVVFREVTIDGETQTEVPGGCGTTLTSFEFQTGVVGTAQ